MLTQDRLKFLLDYDPETGIFVHRLTRRGVLAGTRAGSKDGKGYIGIRVDGERYLAHRLAFLWMTGKLPNNDVDHINRIKHENNWNNLRNATPSQNSANSKKRTIGVEKFGKKYRAKIGGKHIGMFPTFDDARAAYLKAKKELFGEFCGEDV